MSRIAHYVTAETLSEKTSEWLKTIDRYNPRRMELNPPASALLVIDMQRYFLDSSGITEGGRAIVANVKRLIESFRRTNRPVIYTVHAHHPDGLDAGIMDWWWGDKCLEGSSGAQIIENLAPLPSEKVIQKHRYSGFYNTDLETILRVIKVEDLIVTGVMTNLCCESTTRDAYYRDFRVFFTADGTGTISEEMHVGTLRTIAYGFAQVTTVDQMVAAIEK